jgi:hypothetical protein
VEQIPQIKIRGLDEALASIERLSRALDVVGFSVQLATLESREGSVITTPTLPFDDYLARLDPLSRTDALQAPFATSIPELQRLDEAITGLTSALALPRLNGVLGAISAVNTSIRDATTALTNAVTSMNKAIADFKLPPLQVYGISPEQFQVQLGALDAGKSSTSALAATIGSLAIKIGEDLVWESPIIGGGLILGGLGLSAAADTEDDGFFSFDEEAEKHMEAVRSLPNIDTLKSKFPILKADRQIGQGLEFLSQVKFFSDRLRQLDEAANQDATPLLDKPSELFRREQARTLRPIYSRDLLELLARARTAGGAGPEDFDPAVLEIARKYAAQSADQITPSLVPGTTQLQTIRMEPIEIQIKVLSDYRLSMRTVNPNPGVDVHVDMYRGPNSRLFGLP